MNKIIQLMPISKDSHLKAIMDRGNSQFYGVRTEDDGKTYLVMLSDVENCGTRLRQLGIYKSGYVFTEPVAQFLGDFEEGNATYFVFELLLEKLKNA